MLDLCNRCLRVALVLAVAVSAPALAGAQSAGAVTEGAVEPVDSSTASGTSGGAGESMSPGIRVLDDLYFRAGVLVDRPKETRFLDEDCNSPGHLYGCGDGNDGMPLSSAGDFGTTSGFEVGIGRVAAPALRLEAVLSYRPDFSLEGRANFSQLRPSDRREVSADLSALSGMLVAYLDLSERGLPRLGPFRPFVGAGGGLSRIEIDETRMEFPRTMTIVPGGSRVNLSWMLAAGVAVPLGENAMLELAWRYTDHGTVETGRDKGRVVSRDGNRVIFEWDVDKTKAELRGHGLAISLRYPF